jgi:hypothetical protein
MMASYITPVEFCGPIKEVDGTPNPTIRRILEPIKTN